MAQQSHNSSEKTEKPYKHRLISTLYTKRSRRLDGLSGDTAKIWLNHKLFIIKLVILLGIIVPLHDTHAGVISFVSRAFSGNEAEAGVISMNTQNMSLLQATISPDISGRGGGDIAIVDGSALLSEVGVAGTWTDVDDYKSTQISIYVVRQGDSISQIAKMYGVSSNTIVWANNIKGPIRAGDELVILPVSGVNHTITKGDTVRSIASKYKADMAEIISYNSLREGQTLVVGGTIIIPDAEIALVPLSSAYNLTSSLRGVNVPAYNGYYGRPLEGGRKTQGLHGYNGIDFGAPVGTPVYASADGVVIIARYGGWNGGYGIYVVVTHANGTQTLYSHLSVLTVTQGEAVKKGEVIGAVGSTGKSTGPHLHFEVRGAKNPF
jgi:LysM repeat protein